MSTPTRYDRITPHDELFRVRRVWIGVGDWTWPFEARYTAWITAVMLVVALELLARLTLGFSPDLVHALVFFLYLPVFGCLTTWGLFMVVDYERPVGAVVTHLLRGHTARLTRRPQPLPAPTALALRAWARQARPPRLRLRDRLPRGPRRGPRRRAERQPRTAAGGRRRAIRGHLRQAQRGITAALRLTGAVLHAVFIVQPTIGVVLGLVVALLVTTNP